MTSLIEIQYLPSIRYFSKFLLYDVVYINDKEAFEKQSYRNRCRILGANGILQLIVPVHSSRSRLPIREVKIDNHSDWQRIHWHGITSAYGKSAFLEYYIDELAPFYQKKYDFLFDFNLNILQILLQNIGISEDRLRFYSEADLTPNEDLTSCIHPKPKYDKSDENFVTGEYFQTFSDRFNFFPNLSIIDLLFNVGGEAKTLLENSINRI